MKRLVLDTNIWLDWLVFDDPGIALLRAMVSAGEAEIVINDDCENELLRVLAYPLQQWTLDHAGQAQCIARCRNIARRGEIRRSLPLPACADPDDQKFLELAASAGADCLLSKDRALLMMARRRPPLPFHIMTPAEFSQCRGVESADGTLPHTA